MAVDTRAKRESAMLEGFVVPDGTIAAADRLAAVWHYSGIAAAAPAVVVHNPMYPGDAVLSRSGPGDAVLSRSGPSSITLSRSGPGATTMGRRTTS